MSLTSHFRSKRSSVRQFLDRELGGVTPVRTAANKALRNGRWGPPVPPVPGADLGLVGMATEFVFAAVGGTMRRPRIAGARTRELADQRASAAKLALAELQRRASQGPLAGQALRRAADCALVCARLEQRYRMPPDYEMGHPDPAVGQREGLDGVIHATQASEETRADLVALLSASLEDTADLYRARPLYVDSVFALSRALGGADADIIADGLLIDFKASKNRSVIRSIDIYQLVCYSLADLHDWYDIRAVGIQALRWRTRWTISVDDLLEELSGTIRSLAEWRNRFASVVFPEQARLQAMRHTDWPRQLALGSGARPPVREGQ